MKNITILFLAILILILPIGCDRKPILDKNESTIIVATGNNIVTSTDNIDNIVDGSEYEEPVKVETNNIREEIKKLSYEEIEKLYAPKFKQLEEKLKDKDKIISDKDKKIGDLEKLIIKLREEIEKLKEYAKNKQVLILNWLAAILIPVTIALLYFRMKEFAGLSALTSFAFFGVSQVIGSQYFLPVVIGCILIITIFAGYGFFKQWTSNQTEDFVMKTLEETYNSGTPEDKAWMDKNIFDKLSKEMDKRHKDYVREKKLN